MNILIPKQEYDLDMQRPLFFLAGPVRGADDWQKKMSELISEKLPEAYIAIPYYHTKEVVYPLMEKALPGTGKEFDRQLTWERYYLEYAAVRGSVIFWLPAESKINPRPQTGGPYACDTRGELGEWRGRLISNPYLKLVVGGEEEFHGMSQIKRNFDLALRIDFPIYPTIEATAEAAIKKALE